MCISLNKPNFITNHTIQQIMVLKCQLPQALLRVPISFHSFYFTLFYYFFVSFLYMMLTKACRYIKFCIFHNKILKTNSRLKHTLQSQHVFLTKKRSTDNPVSLATAPKPRPGNERGPPRESSSDLLIRVIDRRDEDAPSRHSSVLSGQTLDTHRTTADTGHHIISPLLFF